MPGRKYLYTERAHYMSPNMHFGIMAEIGSEFDADGIIESIGVLRSAHPLMRSLIAEEEGSFESKAGRFVGSKMFGYEKRDGHCITNLGRAESNTIREGVFIPPASPVNRKSWGVLTINNKMRICYCSQGKEIRVWHNGT